MEKANPEVNIDEILKEIDKVSIILYNDDGFPNCEEDELDPSMKKMLNNN